jgi:hypothetical protein
MFSTSFEWGAPRYGQYCGQNGAEEVVWQSWSGKSRVVLKPGAIVLRLGPHSVFVA